MGKIPSKFIRGKIAQLLRRYSIGYWADGNRIEYTITDRGNSQEVSFSIVFTNNTFSHQLHVCKFYPGLYRQQNCRYLSAATFFLLIHHCAQHFHLGNNYSIFLQSKLSVFNDFYSVLKDFAFHIIHQGQGENVDVISPFCPIVLDTSMILPCLTTDLFS